MEDFLGAHINSDLIAIYFSVRRLCSFGELFKLLSIDWFMGQLSEKISIFKNIFSYHNHHGLSCHSSTKD